MTAMLLFALWSMEWEIYGHFYPKNSTQVLVWNNICIIIQYINLHCWNTNHSSYFRKQPRHFNKYSMYFNLHENLRSYVVQYPESIDWRRKGKPTPISLPEKSHGQKSLVDCSPWGRKESGTTGRLTQHLIYRWRNWDS